MSNYLDRLKQLDGEKFSPHTPDIEPTKPTKATSVSFVSTGTGHIEKNFIESSNDNLPKKDSIDTLETDYAELKTFIADLCLIAGHTEEAKEKMQSACLNIYPFQIAEQRDYFRQLVEFATVGRYWTSEATH
jgi:hypothetical protein